MTTSHAVIGTLAVALLSAGCAVDFESYHTVSKLRILAVEVDPPELAMGETAEISVLVANPASDEPITVEWEYCVFLNGAEDGYECQTFDASFEEEIAQGLRAEDPSLSEEEASFFAAEFVDRLGRELPAGETTTFLYDEIGVLAANIMCSNLAEAAESADVPPGFTLPTCDDTLDASLRVVARQGDDEVIGVRTLALLLDTPADDRDLNPPILGLSVTPVVVDGDRVPQALPFGGEVALEVPAATRAVDLGALINEDAAQTYLRNEEDVRENLTMTWFTTAGAFSRDYGYYYEGIAEIDELQNSRLVLGESDFDGGEARVSVFAVVRDNRGGQSFWHGDLLLTEVE